MTISEVDVGAAPDALEFERLYRARHGAVLAYVIRRIGLVGADDLVAETFLVAWRRRYEIPQQDLPWLLGVARNLILHHRRDAGRAGAPVDLDDASLFTEHLDEAVSERQRVLGSLKHLSESDRELLLLTAWDGLSPSEAAAVLGVSAATVRVRLHRARRRFAHALSLADRSAVDGTSTPRRPA